MGLKFEPVQRPVRTRVIDLAARFGEGIREGAACLRGGDVLAFPTETVYGLGALALDARAVRRIFAAKGRPADNPLIVHVADEAMAASLAELSDTARRLMAAFWPGPLTIVLPKKGVPDEVTAGLPTVGVRMPRGEAALALIRACGPLAAPSANASGRPSPTLAEHVLADMNGRIPLILDGGPCAVGLESTVLSLAGEPVLLRPGLVTPGMIERVIGKIRLSGSLLSPLESGETAASPGMKYRHYAPEAEVVVVDGEEEKRREKICALYDAHARAGETCAILTANQAKSFYGARRCVIIGDMDRPATLCANLFRAMIDMEAEGMRALLIEALPAREEGLAFMNRALRAAGFCVINAQ